MNTPIQDPKELFHKICKILKISIFDPTDRACVITRSPSCYGNTGSEIIEWEGSPPRFSIYRPYGGAPLIEGKPIKEKYRHEVGALVSRFLDAHPANKDDSPVWIGTRYKDKP